ncbi:hypothetical protein GDO81_022606 [Engystomops pustulosus]|uniref:Uncharacterized protein n=1 Tax=Engystomops pustulosus TaxID=76066 RepID=A0AAV6ZAK8_ENGPU|nr:hypothetical protein GDO81_022606 [Engystomops pustulosus]KAG8544371.1 hypothetical protein GDO81_022606 [Engystomops pustulosus]
MTMASSIRESDDNERRYLFTRQLKFTVQENLAADRSNNFISPKPILEKDIWKKKPPDFSVRLYRSLQVPRRSEEDDDVKGRKSHHHPVLEEIRGAPPLAPPLVPPLRKAEEPHNFLTRFKPMEPFEANILYVRNGVYPKDKYKDPKPHDFRQYESNIQDFVTSYSRDPFNLKFKAQGLSSSCELPPIDMKKSRVRVKRFILHKPDDPKWESQLLLPRSPWPPKSASYTRHRRRRGVYSAFMDRVEEKFTAMNQELK